MGALMNLLDVAVQDMEVDTDEDEMDNNDAVEQGRESGGREDRRGGETVDASGMDIRGQDGGDRDRSGAGRSRQRSAVPAGIRGQVSAIIQAAVADLRREELARMESDGEGDGDDHQDQE